jgi:hypothetical protein
MKSILCRTIAAALTVALYPAAGFAQTEPRPPVGAVFGGQSATSATSRQKLSITVDLGQSYDQNLIVQSDDAEISLFQGSGLYTVFTPSVDFVSAGDRLKLIATASSNARYYSAVHETLMTNESAGFGFDARLSPDTSVVFNQGVSHAAALLSGLFTPATSPAAGDVAASGSNNSLSAIRSFAYATTASVNRRVGRRSSLLFTSNLQYTLSAPGSGYPDLRSRDAGGVFNYSVTRGVGVRMGYTFRQGEYSGSPRSTEHNLDLGFNYNKPLSATRKATLAFSVGPTIATAPLTAGTSDLRRQYRVIGDASTTYDMGRTWRLNGNYHRGFGYIEGLQGPVFTSAYAAGAAGFLGRRVDLSMSAAYSTGESAMIGSPSQFTTYTGDVRLRYAVTRTWAAYVEYISCYYEFNRQLTLPTFLPPGLNRNGLRTGFMLRIPVRER